jgi:hypothetical protein
MSIKNSFVNLASDIEVLANNSLEVLSSLDKIVKSNESEVQISVIDSEGLKQTISMPTIGFLKGEIDRLNQNLKTLSSVDSRGAIIQPSRNEYKRIIVSDINREPNPISELSLISNFMSEKNLFFDALLNPILKIRLDLTDKIENNVRRVLSKRYIINFENDEFGIPTSTGQIAIDSFNENFKNRSDIEIEELENWLRNTPGIDVDKMGSKIVYDEQEFELEYNNIQYEGFFTILGTEEDTINRKMYFQIDTLDYYEITTGQKRQLAINDELIINTDISTTRYKIIEINNQASELRVRMERVEGYEPIPVSVVGGMKFYSPIINNKSVDISIGFNEYNVIFLKAINTDNYIVSRKFSKGVAYYTNDLTLLSNDNNGQNGKSMQQYYIETVKDFGDLLKDYVDRQIPRSKGVKPNSPVLTDTNFRVVQSNKFLTETTTIEEQRRNHKQINDLRSKIDETNKTIQEKKRELFGKKFRNQKDKNDVQNQIAQLTQQVQSDSALLQSTVNVLLASTQNNTTVDAEYELQGFWQMPNPVENGQTRPQEAITFYIEYKFSNIDGKESENETFKVTESDGTLINAVFSPWKSIWNPIRRRVFDISTQSYMWEVQDLSNIDIPNINSIGLPIRPNERITVRVKTVSEVGYPDALLESDWSNELTITFPTELLQARNPQEIFQKNADLENLRSKIESDLNGKGLTQHLSDSVVFENKYFPHITDNIGSYDANGKLITLTDKIRQLEKSDPVEVEKDIALLSPWVNLGGIYSTSKYYLHEGRVYLSGIIKIDRGSKFKSIGDRFPNVDVLVYGSRTQNTNYSRIGFLPIGYRPKSVIKLSTITYSGNNSQGIDSKSAQIEIYPNGLILGTQICTTWLSLDGLSFRAFQ